MSLASVNPHSTPQFFFWGVNVKMLLSDRQQRHKKKQKNKSQPQKAGLSRSISKLSGCLGPPQPLGGAQAHALYANR